MKALLIFLISVQTFLAHAEVSKLSFEQLAQRMLRNNPDVISAKSNVARAEALQKGVYGINIPNFTASLGYTDNKLDESAVPDDEADQNHRAYDVGLVGALQNFGLNYKMTFGNRKIAQESYSILPAQNVSGKQSYLELEFNLLEDAGFLVGGLPFSLANNVTRAASATFVATLTLQIKTLVEHYQDVALLQRKLENAKYILGLAEKLHKHYTILFKEGRISKVDLLSSEIQLETLNMSILDLTAQTKAQFRELISFVGEYDGTIESEELNSELLPIKIGAVDRLDSAKKDSDFRKNFQLQSLQAQIRVTDSEIKGLDNKTLPTLKLTASKSHYENIYSDAVLTGDHYQHDQWFVGVKLEIPISNVAARSSLAAKKIEQSNLYFQQRQLEKDLDLQMKEMYAELDLLEARLLSAQKIERLTHQRYEATLPLIERSSLSHLDIFIFLNQLRDQQFAVAETESAVVKKRAEILLLRGDLLIPL